MLMLTGGALCIGPTSTLPKPHIAVGKQVQMMMINGCTGIVNYYYYDADAAGMDCAAELPGRYKNEMCH
jgi:hypothetical protein